MEMPEEAPRGMTVLELVEVWDGKHAHILEPGQYQAVPIPNRDQFDIPPTPKADWKISRDGENVTTLPAAIVEKLTEDGKIRITV